MTGSLKILMVSAECYPFAKVGGLGDVTGALPWFLQKLGHTAVIVMPMYSLIDIPSHNIVVAIEEMNVQMGNEKITCRVSKTFLKDKVPVYFIDYEPYFGRSNIYHDNYFNDYPDNPKRFAFLSKAALQLCHELNFSPDIVHSNDWHTAILNSYLKKQYNDDPLFSGTAGVLTIHNLAYQGRYDRSFYGFTGLDEEDFTPDKFECYNSINFLKGGIYFADMVNTVSKGYAWETKTSEGGFGLDHYLKRKGDNYVGILNGVDYSEWDPEIDPFIPANYTRYDLKGKSICKRELQKQLKLDQSDNTPVIGVIGRLVAQKGFYILAECIEDILNYQDVQFAILGAGDNHMEGFYGSLQLKYPGKAGIFIGYNHELAHLIEAGSDFFLMPSIYEPCGLNQIYSLRYGTLPVVRATGGLNDTVENYNQDTVEGTGFKFLDPRGKAICNTIDWVLDTYRNRKAHIQKLIQKAMAQNFSWEDSASEYLKMYYRALEQKRNSMPVL